MLQEGVPRRFLVARGSEGLELLLLPRAPTPCPLSIYCIPLPQATSSLLPPGDQKALLVLVSPVMQNRIGSAVGWTHCRVWSVGKPGSTPWGLLAVKQLHFFYWKEKKKKKRKRDYSGSAIGHRVPTILASPPSRPLPAALCPSVQEKRLVLLRREGGHPWGVPVKERDWEVHRLATCVGLLWNGCFLLALVLAFGHAKVV